MGRLRYHWGVDTIILGTISIVLSVILGFIVLDHRKSQDSMRDALLDTIRSLTIPAKITPPVEETAVHNAEYLPDVELDEWMNGMGMIPRTGGWGPPGGMIPEEEIPQTELPEP